MSALSRACVLLGSSELAAELHELLLPHRSEMVTTQVTWLGPVAHYLGLLTAQLGRFDESERHFAAAAEVQERIATRGTLMHTRLEWARMLLR
ncbi:MAG TPA: hypothetical protein VGL92_01530, partial [Acidimicrobiia bacterium]